MRAGPGNTTIMKPQTKPQHLEEETQNMYTTATRQQEHY